MGRKSEFNSVRFKTNPDMPTALDMLDDISRRRCSSRPRKVDKPLVLYGAGNLGKMANEYFAAIDVPVQCVVDRNPEISRNDPAWEGIDVFGLDQVPLSVKKKALLAVCVVTEAFSKVTAPLWKVGWEDISPFYDIAESYADRHPLSNGWHAGNLEGIDLVNINSVIRHWEDSVSVAHYLQFLAWRVLREEWIFEDAPVTNENRYFIPEVISAMHESEVFVDVGAHHGEVVQKFRKTTQGNYAAIHVFEPDMKNFQVLKKEISSKVLLEDTRISIYDSLLGSRNEESMFREGLGYLSQRWSSGESSVQVKLLDDISIPASFIKIHVEGWEGDVLKGAWDTITVNRPIVTLTSYHSRDGLWRLPQLVMDNFSDYKYYFRLHNWHGTGAVIYAIPTERIA